VCTCVSLCAKKGALSSSAGVCACVWERENDKVNEYVCVFVCEKERETEALSGSA